MKVYGDGWLEQFEKNKPKYKCRKWKIRIRTECGKKSRYFVGSYGEALKAKEDFLVELLEDNKSGGMSFEEYSKKWLKWRQNNPDYSPNTTARDVTIVETLNFWFGSYTLAQISPTIIKDVISKFTSASGNKLSGTGKNMHFVKLSTILRSAVNDGLINQNAMDKVPTPKRDTKEKKCLDKRQIDYLIECLGKEPLDGRIMAMYFMIYLALRSQEAFALKWEDINFRKHTVKIQRAYKRSDRSIGPTKSKAGNRELPIPAPLFNILKEWHQHYKDEDWQCDFICMTTKHSLMSGSCMRKWFGRFRKKYDIDHIAMHELRHSNLTLAARNMNQFDLQRYAGWSSLEPAKIYIHADNESLKSSVDSMFS